MHGALQQVQRPGPMKTLFEVEIDPTAGGSREPAQAVYAQLKAAILDGRLKAGVRLPATRASKAPFGVSRNTVARVYERLSNEGFIVTRKGSGTYVSERPIAVASATKTGSQRQTLSRMNEFWLEPAVAKAMNFWHDPPERSVQFKTPPIDFRPALVDARLFPFDIFRKVSARQLRGLERKPASYRSPQGNQGNYYLRDAITKHIALTRSVVCQLDDVLVTAGAQQAFDILARTLVRPGKTVVAIEDPGYPPMRVAFAAAGATLVPVAVDDEGLVVEDLPADVNIICVCPSHQFPLGVAMSARRRKALVAFARASGAVIVEDDYDGEFRFEGGPLEALRTAEAADVVFYVGTFSKCMLSALRLGFVVAPDWAMATLVAAKNCMDWHCSTPIQIGVAEFIAEGHLTRHVRKMRGVYQERRQLLLSSLTGELKNWLTPVPSLYGMHVAALAHDDLDIEALGRILHRDNVKLHSLRRYYLGEAIQGGVVFGYGAVTIAEMTKGLSILAKRLSAL